MKIFRWWGIAAFFGIVSLIVLGNILFLPHAVRVAVIEIISQQTGAEVNLKQVSIQWQPLAFKLNGLAVTDPEQPEQNIVAFTEGTVVIDMASYLLGHIIIEELTVTGLALHQGRTQSGEVFTEVTTEETAENLLASALPEFDLNLPSPKELLDKSQLITVAKGNALKSTIKVQRKQLLGYKKQLPDSKQLKEYEKRVKALTRGEIRSLEDFTAKKALFDELKKEFKQHKTTIKQLKQQIITSKNAITQATIELKNAPKQDYEQLKQRYDIDDQKIAQISAILFGDQIQQWVTQGKFYYDKVKPFLSTSTPEKITDEVLGRWVHFPPKRYPDWLVKQIHIDWVLPTETAGKGQIKIDNLTFEHDVIQQPTTLNVLAKIPQQLEQLTLFANWQRTPSGDEVQSEWQLDNLLVQQAVLSKKEGSNLVLEQGKVNVFGQLRSAQNIEAEATIELRESRYNTTSSRQTFNIITQTLNNLPNLELKIQASGAYDNLSFKVQSPLDQLLAQAMNQYFIAQGQKLQKQLSNTLQGKLKEQLQQNAGTLWNDQEQLDLTQLDQSLDTLLKSQMNQYEDKLKNKVKDKLGDLFKKFGGGE